MSALQEADLAYGKIVELARRAKIDENRIRSAGLAYNDVRSRFYPTREDPTKVPAFARAIEAVSGTITEALGATPDMDDLMATITAFPAQLMEAFGVAIDFDTAAIATRGGKG